MVTPDEATKSNGPRVAVGAREPNVPREMLAPPDEGPASLMEVEEPLLDVEGEEDAKRPAGEAGLFGDPRPDDEVYDDQDREPEIIRS